MADKTINDLTAATEVTQEDLFVLQQLGTAKKLSGQTLITYLLAMIDGHGGITSISWTESGTSGNGQYHYGTITLADESTSTVTIRDGIKGDTGAAWYMHIRYAGRNPIANTDMSTTPDDWMGVYSGTSATAPADYTAYTWYRIRGDVGAGAQLVSKEILYQVSSSGTTPPGSWQSSIPAISPGQYLWTRITLTFDSGDPVSWNEVSYSGLNGAGAVSSVNSVSPDGNGNVSLEASDIPYDDTTVAASLASLASGAASAQQQINVNGMLKGSGSGAVSAATLGTDYGAKAFTVTLTANGWNGNSQSVTNANFVTSGYAYQVAPDPSYITDYTNSGIYADNVTVANTMTFHCSSAPTGGITVNVIRMVSA